MKSPQAIRTAQPASEYAPRSRQCRRNRIAKNAQKTIVPTTPLANSSSHRWPWVPSGGDPHALQPILSPPETWPRSPCTLRVDPNPTSGDPVRALRVVSSASSVRRLLLCGLSSRSWTSPGSGDSATTIAPPPPGPPSRR